MNYRNFSDWTLLVARIGMSVEFLLFGGMKIAHSTNMQAYMESHGVPGQLIWLAVAVQLVGGILIAIGYRARAAALLLAGFCLVATGIFHTNFSDLREVSDFTKDLAAAGGLIFLCTYGPGSLSVDAWRERRKQPTTS